MIETLTILTITFLLLAYFRPGKTEPLENPLTINRVGKFSAVLAPKINLALPLLDRISGKLDARQRQAGNSRTLCLSVRDKEVRAHGADHYLLAMTLRDGLLYFQATAPVTGQEDVAVISAFVQLGPHATSNAGDPAADDALLDAVVLAARECGAEVVQLGGLS